MESCLLVQPIRGSWCDGGGLDTTKTRNKQIFSRQRHGWSHWLLGILASLVLNACLLALTMVYLWRTISPPALAAQGDACVHTETAVVGVVEEASPQATRLEFLSNLSNVQRECNHLSCSLWAVN